MTAVVGRMRAAAPPRALLVAKSNAGMRELVDMRAVYRTDPEMIATCAAAMRDAGATIIGGCCRTTPAHLAEMAKRLAAQPPDSEYAVG